MDYASNDVTERHVMHINRPIFDQKTFDELYDVNTAADDASKGNVIHRLRVHLKGCSLDRVLHYLPVIKHWKEYRVKEWLLNDILSGISGGVVHVPQAMGYALLAGLPPVYGLYTSIFPGWLYYIFGTSRHLSVGTMALTSLMVGGVVNRQYVVPLNNQSMFSTTTTVVRISVDDVTTSTWHDAVNHTDVMEMNPSKQGSEEVAFKVGIAVSVTLIAGLFQLLMRLFRLGVIASYMSSSFISGFMTASAIQIVVSQIPFQLGLTIRRPYGTFEMPLTLYQVFSNITRTNLSALVASIVSIIFLVAIKEGINEPFKHRLKVPIPAELILVIVATLLAHFFRLNARYGLAVIGVIPTGFPTPRLPPMTSATNYLVDGALLGLVAFAMTVTMAKLMADRHRYEIDVNQELLAVGIHNTVSAFFGCFVSTQAPPRTMVQETTGCKTQLTGFVSTFLPLLVILYIGPLFESLPISVLACIISCALIPLMKQFQQLRSLWIVSRYDLAVWIVTFLSTAFLSVTLGLVLGIAFSILATMIQLQRMGGHALKQAGDTEIYRQSDDNITTIGHIFVFRFDGPVIFINADKFVEELYRRTINPLLPLLPDKTIATENKGKDKKWFSVRCHRTKNADDNDVNNDEFQTNIDCTNEVFTDKETTLESNIEREVSQTKVPDAEKEVTQAQVRDTKKEVRTVVIDCSKISVTDVMGINALKKVLTAYKLIGADLVVAGCSKQLTNKLIASGIVRAEAQEKESDADLIRMRMYPTVHDAVVSAQVQCY